MNEQVHPIQVAVEKQITRHGGLRAAARAMGIAPSYLCRLRWGEKDYPDDAILRKLGLRRVISYESIRP